MKIEKRYIVILSILALLGGGCATKDGGSYVPKSHPSDTDQLSDTIITCDFAVSANVSYENEKNPWAKEDRTINYEAKQDSEVTSITFAGLDSSAPRLKGNNGDSPLTVVKDDAETTVLVEKNAMGDIFFYTIFKEEKVAIWQKSYKLIVVPFGLLSMGKCY